MLDDEFDMYYDEELEFDEEFEDEFEDDEDDFADDYDEFYDEEDFEGFDLEGDEFWGSLKKIARKVGGAAKRVAKKLAPIAKRHAGKIGTVIGGAVAGPAGAAIGGKIGGIVKNLEDEDEYDTEDEMEAVMPIPALDDSLAEAMAAAATKAKPSDAQALGGAITITIMSKAPIAVKTVAPALVSASGRIARTMAADPRGKELIRTLPTIVKKTAATLNQKARKGKPVTKGTAARVMTKHAKRTLRSQARLARALANNSAKKRRLDKAAIARAEKFY